MFVVDNDVFEVCGDCVQNCSQRLSTFCWLDSCVDC